MMTDPDSMKLFDFDESDLQANRNGRLTEKQKTTRNVNFLGLAFDKEARDHCKPCDK